MDLKLKNQTAILTGAAGGIGRKLAAGLVAEGCHVALLDLSEEKADDAAKQAAKSDPRGEVKTKAFYCDVTKRLSVESAFAAIECHFGPAHILINSHQYWPHDWFVDITDDQWHKTLDVNLTSYYLTCQAMVKQMLRHKMGGSILNISSQAAFRGATTGHAHYAAAKAGILGLTKSIAREVATQGITCNALAPGMALTPATEKALEENMEKYLDRIPLRRIAEPEEVADVAIFLVSPRAKYMTGTTVDISGGLLMH